jgi:hypothetical protein
VREATYYSYTFPEPAGLREQPLRPGEAVWAEEGRSPAGLLPYEAVRAVRESAWGAARLPGEHVPGRRLHGRLGPGRASVSLVSRPIRVGSAARGVTRGLGSRELQPMVRQR